MACGATLKRRLDMSTLDSSPCGSPQPASSPCASSPSQASHLSHKRQRVCKELCYHHTQQELAMAVIEEAKSLNNRKVASGMQPTNNPELNNFVSNLFAINLPTLQTNRSSAYRTLGGSPERATNSPSSSSTSLNTPAEDRPVFSLKQVMWMCSKVLEKREDMVKNEFEKLLTERMQAQYNDFMAFYEEQFKMVSSKTSPPPTYLS